MVLVILFLFLMSVAIIVGSVVLLSVAISAIIGGIILLATGSAITAKTKKKTFGKVLIVVSLLMIVPAVIALPPLIKLVWGIFIA